MRRYRSPRHAPCTYQVNFTRKIRLFTPFFYVLTHLRAVEDLVILADETLPAAAAAALEVERLTRAVATATAAGGRARLRTCPTPPPAALLALPPTPA